MSWLSVRVRTGVAGAERDGVMRALFELGSQGVQEDGEVLATWFTDEISRFDVDRALDATGFRGDRQYGLADPVDWTEAWKEQVKAQVVDGILVCPPWLARQDGAEKFTVVIEPGMAFGTGDHASTRCALRLVNRWVVAGSAVADLGAGSAVLSIAAAKLGARHVVAIENDADAIGNALENVSRNGVGEQVTVLENDAATVLPLVAPVDVVVANMVSSLLLSLLAPISKALSQRGCALLSGILVSERAEFEGELVRHSWRILDEVTEGEWCALAIGRL